MIGRELAKIRDEFARIARTRAMIARDLRKIRGESRSIGPE
jgi:hypothetical protein